MTKKKILALMLAGTALSASLVGCGSTDKKEEQTSTSESQEASSEVAKEPEKDWSKEYDKYFDTFAMPEDNFQIDAKMSSTEDTAVDTVEMDMVIAMSGDNTRFSYSMEATKAKFDLYMIGEELYS